LSLYLFWKAIDINAVSKQSEGYGLWLLLGITMGLGLLTKYTMGFFHLCGLLFLLLSDKKGILKTAKPYLAVFVSIVVFSPVIIWNLQYDWVTFRHMTGHANIAAGMTVSAKDFFEFLGSQIGIVTPVFFIVMCIALFRKYPASLMTQYRFLFFFAVPVVGFFILKSVQGKVQANWAMTGYITGIIALAYYLADTNVEKISLKRYKLRQRVKWAGVVTALLITVVSLYPSIINLSPRLDPSARLRGWKQLGVELTKIYNGLWEKGGVLIFSDSYQISSEMAFYIKGNPITYCININRRMNQYDLWPGINAGAAQMRQQNKGSGPYSINGIYVSYDDTALPQTVADAFDNCEKKLIKAHDRKFFLRDYSVFICYNFKGLTTTKTDTY
jgi:undecaprenyl-diphosphatase